MNFLRSTRLAEALHVFLLFNIGLVLPVFEVVSGSADFLLVRKSGPFDILATVFLFTLILPVIMIGFEILIGLINEHLRASVHLAFLSILFAISVLVILNRTSGTSPLAISISSGLIFAAAYHRWPTFRSFLTFCAPAILLVPFLFILDRDVRKIVFPHKVLSQASKPASSKVPVVLVVFDALPLSSLLNEHGNIDKRLYPNFAHLAKRSTWYRNASAVSALTVHAVPAILTGKYPVEGKLPVTQDHPENLFTLLQNSHKIHSFETITRMSPGRLGWTFSLGRVKKLSDSLFHVGLGLLQRRSSQTNPDGSLRWTNIHLKAATEIRQVQFRNFLRSIQSENETAVYFLHLALPHLPYEHLGSGKYYTPVEVNAESARVAEDLLHNDPDVLARTYQKHLLQVQYVDTLLGDLLKRLQATGLLNHSMLIITADHGVAFLRNRVTSPEVNFLMSVPLFIKFPGQLKGEISEENIQTIDILPTIAKAVAVKLPWNVDGAPAGKIPSDRQNKRFYSSASRPLPGLPGSLLSQNQMMVRERLSLFGNGPQLRWLQSNPHASLIGRTIETLPVQSETQLRLSLVNREAYEKVNLESDVVPAFVLATLTADSSVQPLNVAVLVNGVVGGVTSTFQKDAHTQVVAAIVPESFFIQGKNDIEFLLVKDEGESNNTLLR